MALRLVCVAAAVAGTSVADAAAAVAPNPSGVTSSEFQLLQSLVSQLADAAPQPRPKPAASQVESVIDMSSAGRGGASAQGRSALRGEGAQAVREASQAAAADGGLLLLDGAEEKKPAGVVEFPDAEGDSAVLVFEEAEQAVERAMRKLAPSPGPTPFPEKVYCTFCDVLYDQDMDQPEASVCYKEVGKGGSKERHCWKKHYMCPSDMVEETCYGYAADAPAAPPPPFSTDCSDTLSVTTFQALASENALLFETLMQLKRDELTMIEDLITKAERDDHCACAPVNLLDGLLSGAPLPPMSPPPPPGPPSPPFPPAGR